MPLFSPHALRRFLRDLSIPKKLTVIIGLFCVVVVLLLTLSYGGMEILSGSRAYVSGEGFYSKAQKAAIYRLTRYALFRQEADYEKYLIHISIISGDHQARLALSQPVLDENAVRQGFVQGRNDPADINIMTFMARRLNGFRYMDEAISLWGQADAYMDRLQVAANALHREVLSPQPSTARIRSLLEEITAIDAAVTPLEDRFSTTLGEGARWLKRTLMILMAIATCAFLIITLAVAFIISRQLCKDIEKLHTGATRIAAGDYSYALDVESHDEIGDLAKSFQEMATQRQLAERAKDEFFANVSHELRTPLTLILSPLESLLASDRSPMDPRLKPSLEIMHNNAMRLLQLVNGLLDFSKLEAGQVRATLEPVHIGDVTEMVYKDFQPLVHQRGLESQLTVAPARLTILTDRYLYERMLFNLLSNAIKFTERGGKISVTLAWAKDKLTLTVSDTGIGIAKEELDNIFKRFQQVEGSSTRRFEGTGLGLALVKEFSTLLKGTVSVESTPHKGSTFTVTCAAARVAGTSVENRPMHQEPLHARPQKYAPNLEPTSGSPVFSDRLLPKLLIAEDNAEMAAYIASLLQPFCQTKVVRDGHEALAAAKEWAPDIILTDVMMPERDGISLCRDIKAGARTASIPVVMLTAMTHRDALLEGWKAGADEYLFKPFHPKELQTRIQSLLKSTQDRKRSREKIAQLNENLRVHAAELEAANQELESFSYSVSHDLRTPLRAIDGFSRELLQNNADTLSARSKEDLARILAATERMGQLIEDLLELSRLSRSELKRENVDLSAMAHEITDELKAMAPERTLDAAITPHLSVLGDSHLLRIALRNLFENAWKFTRHRPVAQIEFGVSLGGPHPVFHIKDNGTGFNMEYADKLFQPFQRLHDAKDYPGTGIGLALVQRIIRRHNGTIRAQAATDLGATFSFTIPQTAQANLEKIGEFA